MKPKNKLQSRRATLLKAQPYLFLSPSVLALLFMFGYPLLSCFYIAFNNYNLKNLNNVYFVGFGNFTKLFTDSDLGMVARNTLIYVAVCVVVQFVLGLIIALALWKPFPLRSLYQGIIFLPWAMSSFVVGLMFRWSFNGEYGVVNDLLLKLGLIDSKLAWLGTQGLSMFVVMLAVIWIGVPFFGIMILAALQSIPTDIFEAADIDGCGMIQRFLVITVPYIKPTIITTILLRTIWIFNGVEMIMVVTEGGPASTSEILSSYLYTKAYASLDFGFAAALGLLFMLGLVTYVLVYLKVSNYSKAGDF